MSKKAAVWLIAGGPMQKAMAEEVKKNNFALIVSDRNPECACAPFADEIVDVDTFDIEHHISTAEVLRTRWDIKAVVTAGADCHETVAHVARHLGLHGIDPEIAHMCRYKVKTRALLAAHGIYQPKSALVSTRAEALDFCKSTANKVVLKATNNSGSRGFISIDHLDLLTEENFQHTLSYGTTGSVIVEEKLVPDPSCIAEQSVETLWYNGQMYWLNWVDRLFRQDLATIVSEEISGQYAQVGFAVEVGHINPAMHSHDTQDKVMRLMAQAGEALGMTRQRGGHILKADIMQTVAGPVIIELTPRLSGGWDSSLTTPMRGGNFVGGVLQLALGRELDLDLWKKYFSYRYPSTYSAIICRIKEGAKDSIGRTFYAGSGFTRKQAIEKAYVNLQENAYVL